MQKTKLISLAVASAMLCLTVATLGEQLAQARNITVSMLRYRCAGSSPGRWSVDEQDVAVARSAYRSLMSLRPSNGAASVACRIVPENSRPQFQTLELEFGMLDGETASPPNIVNIYLDGRQVASRTVGPTQRASLSVNVSNVSSVAIETICSSRLDYCGRVYFWKADLERAPDPNEPRL